MCVSCSCVSEFFSFAPKTIDGDWDVVVGVSHGVVPRLCLTCIGLLDVHEAVFDFFSHDLMNSIGMKYACDSPIES